MLLVFDNSCFKLKEVTCCDTGFVVTLFAMTEGHLIFIFYKLFHGDIFSTEIMRALQGQCGVHLEASLRAGGPHGVGLNLYTQLIDF